MTHLLARTRRHDKGHAASARLALVLMLTCISAGGLGCGRGEFTRSGFVAVEGGALRSWSSAPLGCTRAAFDGKPDAETSSIATFIWEDPGAHELRWNYNLPDSPDRPLRLEIGREGGGFSAGLTTKKTEGTRIVSADCARFEVQTWQEPPLIAGARPSLTGRLQMDCKAKDGRVTADLRFRRCEF